MNEVKIGGQIWMGQNLNNEIFQNGEKILSVNTTDDWMAALQNKIPACCDYKDEKSNGEIYGKIYNWFAVVDPRNIALNEWRVPLVKDWEILVESIGLKNLIGKSLKHPDFWGDSAGSNEFGFSALPGGFRGSFGSSMDINKRTGWWSATEWQPLSNKAWVVNLDSNVDTENLSFKSFEILKADVRMNGYYLRCLKNE
jgi:uncharacterized protein (TIGR02145 family)